MEDLQRRQPGGKHRPGWLLSDHVVWPVYCRDIDACCCCIVEPVMLLVAGPLLGLWLVSPLVAWWLSRTLRGAVAALTASQRAFLPSCLDEPGATSKSLSPQTKIGFRRTTFRRNRRGRRIAHQSDQHRHGRCWRTWPPATSAIAAPVDCSIASSKTFGTLARMERYRGHFYNWYDTRSLKPLPPLYVSTVDSGNLVGYLLVLRSGLLELIETKLLRPPHLQAWTIRLSVLLDVARGLHRDGSRSQRCAVGDRRCAVRKLSAWQTTWRIDPTPDSSRRRSCNGSCVDSGGMLPLRRARTRRFVGGPAPWSVRAPTSATTFFTSHLGGACCPLPSNSSDSTSARNY